MDNSLNIWLSSSNIHEYWMNSVHVRDWDWIEHRGRMLVVFGWMHIFKEQHTSVCTKVHFSQLELNVTVLGGKKILTIICVFSLCWRHKFRGCLCLQTGGKLAACDGVRFLLEPTSERPAFKPHTPPSPGVLNAPFVCQALGGKQMCAQAAGDWQFCARLMPPLCIEAAPHWRGALSLSRSSYITSRRGMWLSQILPGLFRGPF